MAKTFLVVAMHALGIFSQRANKPTYIKITEIHISLPPVEFTLLKKISLHEWLRKFGPLWEDNLG
jgi:hypothetical protein